MHHPRKHTERQWTKPFNRDIRRLGIIQSANPVASYTFNKESPEYVRFVNPSDYRIVEEASCHAGAIRAAKTVSWRRAQCFGVVPHIIMASCHSKLYSRRRVHKGWNGSFTENPTPVTEEMKAAGILESLAPLPAWETIPPGRYF